MADSPANRRGIALALSGGGFRATLFHLGALIRLNQLGWLPKLDAISAVSGGSITGAYLGYKWRRLEFKDGRAANLGREIVDPLRELCRRSIDLLPSLTNIVINLWGGTNRFLRDKLAYYLFNDATLRDLPDPEAGPRIVITAASLQTGSHVLLERAALSDPRLGRLDLPDIPLAAAVAASCAFPPFLSPEVITTEPDLWRAGEGADLATVRRFKSRLVLTDGGAYDPLALEPVWSGYRVLLVSDASQMKTPWVFPSANWVRQLNRTTLLQTFGNAAVSRQLLRDILDKCDGERLPRGAYWAVDDTLAQHMADHHDSAVQPLLADSDATRALCRLRTRLSCFSDAEQTALINWGYALSDAAARSKLNLPDDPPAQLPFA